MILKRKPTIKSGLAVFAVVGAAIAISYVPGDPRDVYWAVPFWVAPVVLGHFVRSRRKLFCACLLAHIALVVAATAACTILSPESQGHCFYLAGQTEDALNLPATAMRFPFLYVWWEGIARSVVVSAPIYGLVAAVYATTCVLLSPDGCPVPERPIRHHVFAFVRAHRRALLIVLPPAMAFISTEYVLHSRRAREMDGLYQRLKITRSDYGESATNVPGVPFQRLRRGLGLDHWFLLTRVDLHGKWTKSDADLLRPFRYLEAVGIADGQSAEAVLEVVGDLPHLRRVALTGVSDAGMKRLGSINRLVYLSLSETNITDEGFAVICQGQKLRHLCLNNSTENEDTKRVLPARLTERAICSLTVLKGLRLLAITDNGLTDICLRELAKLPHLEAVHIGSVQLTGTGFSYLSGAEQLKELSYTTPIKLPKEESSWSAPPRLVSLFLPDHVSIHEFCFHLGLLDRVTFVRAWGLNPSLAMYLPLLKNLKRIELVNSDIEDYDLKGFEDMKQLSLLDIRFTHTTRAGVAKLQKALPNCEILSGNDLFNLSIE